MRLEQLEYIITINECRSINKAAKKLFISPQTLYSSLAALEEELGFPIFLRNTKGVAITYLGQQIINDAQNMIKTLKKWQEISENPQSVSNEIRIAAGGVFNSLLVEIIARLHETYPKATINLKHINAPSFFQNNSQEILDDDIIMASIDCSLADQIYTIIQHKGYCTMELGLDTLSLFISASHPLAQKPFITLEDLWDLSLAVYAMPNQLTFLGGDLIKYFSNSLSFRVNSLDQLFRIIATGQAVGFGPHFTVKDNLFFEIGQIKALPLLGMEQRCAHFISYPNKSSLSIVEQFVVDEVLSSFALFKEQNILV